ncbi:MAG: PepSY domain-containing protein [Microcystaceae cyanobacterium]
MKASTTVILAAAMVGTLGLGALVRIVYATQPNSQGAIMHQHHSRTPIAEGHENNGETNDDANEQEESAQLQSLAKITPQQAQQAAEKAVEGKATSVQLENDDGNLVYAVKIALKEVKVDAGNGRVLYVENANQENEGNEASRPHSSIQIPHTNDDEREVNERDEH